MISLTLWSGCDSNITTPQGGSPSRIELIPLALGNNWVFRSRTYGYQDPYLEDIDTSRIDTAFLWNGNFWYGSRGGRSFATNDSVGYWWFTLDADDTTREVKLYLYFPVRAGQSWKRDGDSATVTVAGLGVQATTPAGTFSGCIQYDVSHRQGVTEIMIFKPGIGFIKSQYDNSTTFPPVSVTTELMSFYVKR